MKKNCSIIFSQSREAKGGKFKYLVDPRVAENSSLHWHVQKGTTALLGQPPASSQMPAPLPQKDATQMPAPQIKLILNIFWNPVIMFIPL